MSINVIKQTSTLLYVCTMNMYLAVPLPTSDPSPSVHASSSSSHRTRRQDTNIMAVQFNTLTEPGHMHTGDAQFCSNEKCGAIVSHLSKLEDAEDEDTKVTPQPLHYPLTLPYYS